MYSISVKKKEKEKLVRQSSCLVPDHSQDVTSSIIIHEPSPTNVILQSQH